MKRRSFIQLAAVGCTSLLSPVLRAPGASRDKKSRPSYGRGFELDELTIPDLQRGMSSGRFTAVFLTRSYLDRIDRIDRQGPRLRAVLEVNPDALEIARALDRERKANRLRGPF